MLSTDTAKPRTLGVGQYSISALFCNSTIPIFISEEVVLVASVFPSSMLVCRKEHEVPGAGARECTGIEGLALHPVGEHPC